jgi:hypothetical protein
LKRIHETYFPTVKDFFSQISSVPFRVTGLGDYSNGQLFLKITGVAKFLATLFYGKSCALGTYVMLTKLAVLHFGRVFHKLIWSPWFRLHLVAALVTYFDLFGNIKAKS